MRYRIASWSWISGLAVAVAVTSFMVSAPAEAVRTCRSEQQVVIKRVCTSRPHFTGRSWHVAGKTWPQVGANTARCRNRRVTQTVLVCHQSPAVPRAPKPGRPPIKLN